MQRLFSLRVYISLTLPFSPAVVGRAGSRFSFDCHHTTVGTPSFSERKSRRGEDLCKVAAETGSRSLDFTFLLVYYLVIREALHQRSCRSHIGWNVIPYSVEIPCALFTVGLSSHWPL